MLRFSLKNHAAESFVAQFVHAGVPVGSDEHERHRHFLTFGGLASGCLLALVPLVVAGNQAQPGLWAAIAAVAALPFFLAVLVSRTGRLDAALHILTLSFAAGFGFAIAMTGALVMPLILIAALACVEPTLWRMRRPVVKGAEMAVIAAASVPVWGTAVAPVSEVSVIGGAALWITAAAYLASIVTRIAQGKAEIEARARRDAEFCDLLAANTKDLITTHGRDGAASFVAPSSKSLIGTTPAEMAGNGFIEKVHLQDRITFLKAVSDVWHSRGEQTLKFRMRRKGDAEKAWMWIETTLRVRVSDNGGVTSVVASSRDVTGDVDRDSERAKELRRHEDTDAAQKRFLATMSHELRTPLNAIIGFADVLEHELFGALEQERHREYVSHIHSSGEHLLNVVNDMLDMSRIDSGRYELDYTEFSLAEIADATLGMLLPLAQKGNVTVVRDVNENLPAMRGDRRSWQQILINLVSNAIKFTPEGGTVRLTARQFGRNVKISIKDTGIGIDPEFLKSIGEPFMQAESGADRRFEGSGLGLFVVKGLVDLHGGDFDISSLPDKGTTATVILPIQPAVTRAVPHTEDVRVIDLPEEAAGKDAKATRSEVSKGVSHARLSA